MLELLAYVMSLSEILGDYPFRQEEGLLTCLKYAA
ncbi:hypothetical protein MCERE19_00375 [Spirosomataceae bacterium]|jgi:uncharacterized protein (DUF433 family)